MAKAPAAGGKKTEAKAATKDAKAAPAAPKANSAFMKPMKPSAALAAVVGADALPRSEVVSKMWDYIRKHKLQNPENKREIIADAKLEPIFGAKKCTMFEMNKHLARHLS